MCALLVYEFIDVVPSPQFIVPLYDPVVSYGNIIDSDGVVVTQTEMNDGGGVGVQVLNLIHKLQSIYVVPWFQ